jgi:hypothetical protein
MKAMLGKLKTRLISIGKKPLLILVLITICVCLSVYVYLRSYFTSDGPDLSERYLITLDIALGDDWTSDGHVAHDPDDYIGWSKATRGTSTVCAGHKIDDNIVVCQSVMHYSNKDNARERYFLHIEAVENLFRHVMESDIRKIPLDNLGLDATEKDMKCYYLKANENRSFGFTDCRVFLLYDQFIIYFSITPAYEDREYLSVNEILTLLRVADTKMIETENSDK